MATSPSPAPVVCLEKRRLLQAFATAVSDYNRMHSFQVAELMKSGDFSYEAELAKAADRRDAAKYAVLAHEGEHGC